MIKLINKPLSWWRPPLLQMVLLLALLQLSVALLTDGFALSFDEAMWHYIGRNWFRHGMVPYTGGVDNKSPLIFAVFGLSDRLFGLNYWFPRVLGTIFQSIGIWYIHKIAKHLAGERAGLLALSFYGLSLLWQGTGGRYVAFTETYDMLFIIAALYQYITAKQKQDFFIAGLLAGVGLAFRLTAIWGISAILISELRKSRVNALTFCSGAVCAVLSLLIIGLFFHIDPHSILTYALIDNFGSGSTTDHQLVWKLVNFSAKFFYSELILFYPFVLGYFFIKKRLDLYGLWLILGFIGVNIVGIYGVMHIRELLPAMSLMSAFSVSYLIEKYHVPPKQLMIIIWIVFFPKLLEPLLNLKKLITGDRTQPAASCGTPFAKPGEGARKRLGQWIKDNTGENDKVFVAGFGAQVLAYSERVSPTIYFNVTQTRIAKQRYYLDLKTNKPVMVLVPLFSEYTQFVSPDMRQYLDIILAKDYHLEGCMFNYNIYRIKR